MVSVLNQSSLEFMQLKEGECCPLGTFELSMLDNNQSQCVLITLLNTSQACAHFQSHQSPLAQDLTCSMFSFYKIVLKLEQQLFKLKMEGFSSLSVTRLSSFVMIMEDQGQQLYSLLQDRDRKLRQMIKVVKNASQGLIDTLLREREETQDILHVLYEVQKSQKQRKKAGLKSKLVQKIGRFQNRDMPDSGISSQLTQAFEGMRQIVPDVDDFLPQNYNKIIRANLEANNAELRLALNQRERPAVRHRTEERQGQVYNERRFEQQSSAELSQARKKTVANSRRRAQREKSSQEQSDIEHLEANTGRQQPAKKKEKRPKNTSNLHRQVSQKSTKSSRPLPQQLEKALIRPPSVSRHQFRPQPAYMPENHLRVRERSKSGRISNREEREIYSKQAGQSRPKRHDHN